MPFCKEKQNVACPAYFCLDPTKPKGVVTEPGLSPKVILFFEPGPTQFDAEALSCCSDG